MDITPEALDTVEGWFADLDQALFHLLLERSAQPGGDLAEMGVYLGKSAILIGSHCHVGEVFTVVDLFGDDAQKTDNQEENDRSYPSLTREAFERNYLRFHPSLPTVLAGPSSDIMSTASRGSHRFVHIDASHLYEHVVLDIENARQLLRPNGLVVLDDHRSAHTPGVAAAAWQAVAAGMHVVALTESKMYATWGAAEPWQREVQSWAQGAKVGCQSQQVMGAEMLVLTTPRTRSVTDVVKGHVPYGALRSLRRLRRMATRS